MSPPQQPAVPPCPYCAEARARAERAAAALDLAARLLQRQEDRKAVAAARQQAERERA
jgi:hypothetical protein